MDFQVCEGAGVSRLLIPGEPHNHSQMAKIPPAFVQLCNYEHYGDVLWRTTSAPLAP